SHDDWYIKGQSTSVVDGNQTIGGFTLNGNNRALAHGVSIVGRSNVTIEDMSFLNINDTALMVVGLEWWEDADPDFRLGSPPPSWATHCTIRNVRTTACALRPLQSAIWVTTLQDSLLDNVVVDESAASGGRGNAIKGWPGFLKHTVIRHSSFIVEPSLSDPIPMEIWNWMSDSEVHHCLFKGGYLSLVSGNASGGTWALRFHDNVIDGTNVRGAGHELALSDLDFYDNYAFDYGLSIWVTGHGWTAGTAGIHNVRLRNNIIKNPSPSGIYLTTDASGSGPLSDIQILNNVIDGGQGPWGSKDGVFAAANSGHAISNMKIQNNIIQHQDNAVVLSGQVTSPTVSHNDYFDVRNGGGDNLSVDPRFAGTGSSANEIYALTAASPVIDQGTDVGLPYTGSAPDLGASEFSQP
ncbi:MAG: right-handed parallel beta-helix repeat-containing protein, partial [Deltaproteobacteria bacterium]|nr:right-handed parallel beta-helix repeat-containing protein [Deltaproteobacteria bacterium]